MGKHSNYAAIDGHPSYYRNNSGIIIFRKRINRRQITISTGTDSIKKAKDIVDRKLIEKLSHNPSADLRKRRGISNPLLSELWPDLMNEKGPTSEESTFSGYNSSWKYGIEPFWGNKTVIDITPNNITAWENWYLKTNGERVFFNTRKHFIMLMSYLKDQKLIESVLEVKRLDEIIIKKTKKQKVGRVYTEAEVQAMIKKAVNERTRLGILIYRYMGLRKNELLKSEASSWDLKKRIAEIWSYKNKKWRTIPIPDIVLKPLKAWVAKLKSKFLFPTVTDPEKHLSSQVFDKDWTKTKELAKISNWDVENAARVHDLRHTFATQTKNDGWHPLVACRVLDMSLKEYERTYVHITIDEIELLMKKSFGSRP